MQTTERDVEEHVLGVLLLMTCHISYHQFERLLMYRKGSAKNMKAQHLQAAMCRGSFRCHTATDVASGSVLAM